MSDSSVDQAVIEGGTYEVLRSRLLEQGKLLEQEITDLNQQRINEFGQTELKVLGRLRMRTEHNCSARDLVRIGDWVLLGYNVSLGLKKTTKISDVFALYRPVVNGDQYDVEEIALKETFLNDPQFVNDFRELYNYYNTTKLTQLVVKDGKLLAAFQIGDRLTDQRVFRWLLTPDGNVDQYIDNRGERDIALPEKYDFEWRVCTRDDVVQGRNPHYNVADRLFIDCQQGDLTVKVENNTNTGKGIFSDPVDVENQSIDDCEVAYAELGQLILLRVLPYQEPQARYLVFNPINETVVRIDQLGQSCVQLPEDHGIVFPGGYYLASGEYKTYDDDMTGMTYKRTFRAPNGEDVLFVFYEPHAGKVGLFNYNLIEKKLHNPLFGHGYGFFADGRLALFYAEDEATRVHPLQIWQTPFTSDEFAGSQPVSQSFYGRIGNPELVHGIADLFSIVRNAQKSDVSSAHFNQLSKDCHRLFDAYHWLGAAELPSLANKVRDIAATSELVLDEFEKVIAIRAQSEKALTEAAADITELQRTLNSGSWKQPQDFVTALAKIRQQRGHLLTLKDYRYIDLTQIEQFDAHLQQYDADISQQTLSFLSDEAAFTAYHDEFKQIADQAPKQKTVTQLKPFLVQLDELAAGLDLLSELMTTLAVEDPTIQTRIVDSISSVYGQLNQHKARVKQLIKSMGSEEARAQFGARFKLLGQSVNNALGMATTPEKADEHLARLLVQLEELESQFSEHDEFLADILSKREEIFETFEGHKQTLLEARQRRSKNIFSAAERILSSIKRRSSSFKDQDELNTFFASDALVLKINALANDLRELDDAVRADDLESKLKAEKDQAIRALRDQSELYEGGGQVIKLGPRHRFSVNTQPLDITLLEHEGEQRLHLTGTDYYQSLTGSALDDYRDLWQQHLPSENDRVYRAEYLAYQILIAAQNNEHGFNWTTLQSDVTNTSLMLEQVQRIANARYKDAYQKGVHDQDATTILCALVPKVVAADAFCFSADVRSLAISFWALNDEPAFRSKLMLQAKTALMQRDKMGSRAAWQRLQQQLSAALTEFVATHAINTADVALSSSADYLIQELATAQARFAVSSYAEQLLSEFDQRLALEDHVEDFNQTLQALTGCLGEQREFISSWLSAFVGESDSREPLRSFIAEAVAVRLHRNNIALRSHAAELVFRVEKLFGEHPRIDSAALTITVDEFLTRLKHFSEQQVPRWQALQDARQQVIDQYRQQLRLDQYKAKPLSSFVRNKLISEVYLPIIGDNLAKQMGTVGDSKRTDLMGLLLMISPPGYGKTTLMEYVADRLGLVFMKINCPSIGHEVTSIDPATASNSASRQELEKLNLALEMGNNVMLYLDDIQHTNPEFLQKFISLCDGTRRIEGVWQGQSKTYDMRGKKFCVVMAGNPYTESGELFQIPDMLANRADIYNLGDELSGKEDVFALSYLENALTSNPVLAKLATRSMADFYKLVEMTERGEVSANDLEHPYSAAELNEITEVLRRLMTIQKVVLAVNRQYIASAATADRYRTEPPFKLQGSYRNMNKMAEKVNAVMTEQEMQRMIGDHYQGEAQLLTQGAEENLLKLAQLRNVMSEAEQQRWQMILASFAKQQAMGGDDADTGTKVVSQLVDLVEGVRALQSLKSLPPEAPESNSDYEIQPVLSQLTIALNGLAQQRPSVQVVNQPVPGIDKLLTTLADTFENSLIPLAKIMDGKINIDLKNLENMRAIQKDIRQLAADMAETKTGRPD